MSSDSPAIETRGLSRKFAADVALADFDLEVHRSQIHAIVGLNGAGKTTLMRLLVGMLRAQTGSARVLGVEPLLARANTWSRVGHLIESSFAYPELTTRQNLAAAAMLHGVGREDLSVRVTVALHDFGLHAFEHKPARVLSLGNRQRLGLASALCHQPDVVILDEPTSALDPAGVMLVRSILTGLRDSKAAVLVSSHHLDEVARVADQITVMHHGRIVGGLDPRADDLESRFFEMVYAADSLRWDRPG